MTFAFENTNLYVLELHYEVVGLEPTSNHHQGGRVEERYKRKVCVMHRPWSDNEISDVSNDQKSHYLTGA